MTDIEVIERIQSKYSKHIFWRKLDSDIIEYLKTRFEDSESVQESYYRIVYNISQHPKCPICGNPVKFIYKHGFHRTCENKVCISEYKRQNNSFKNPETQQKVKETILRKYGVENPYNIDHVKRKCLENSRSEEANNKRNKTNLERYGNTNPAKSVEVGKRISESLQNRSTKDKQETICKRQTTYKEKTGYLTPSQNPEIIDLIDWNSAIEKRDKTMIELYGVKNPMMCNELKLKKYSTEKTNHSYNGWKSKLEDKVYKILKEKFLNVERQYFSERYPFKCDFYIPSIDTYIEFQGHPTHGTHPYDPKNENDILKAKSIADYYGDCVTWTIRDPIKRETAKKNNLNYIEFWNLKEVRSWINTQ